MFVKEAFAQIINPAIPPSLGNVTSTPGPVAGIGNLLGAIIAMFLIVGALAAFIFLALGALRWITSGGDKAKLEQGREEITNAIIGLVVLAAVWAIMIIVSTFLGLGTFTSTNGIFNLPILQEQGAQGQLCNIGGVIQTCGTGGNGTGQTTPQTPNQNTNGTGNNTTQGYRLTATGCVPDSLSNVNYATCQREYQDIQSQQVQPPTYTCVNDANYYRACNPDCSTGAYRELNSGLTCATGVCCQQHK